MLIDVLAADAIPVGAQKCVEVEGINILICHTPTGLYAIKNLCTHAAMTLEGGRVVKDAIRCPAHGAKFSLATGQPPTGSRTRAVQTFSVHIEGDRILLEVGSPKA